MRHPTTAEISSGARLLLASFVVFLGHVIGTQYVAHQLHYQDRFLGQALMVDEAVGAKLYWPHRVYSWLHAYYGGHIDSILELGGGFALASFAVGGVGFWVLGKVKPVEHLTAHGSSRWATPEEVKGWGWTISVLERVRSARNDPQVSLKSTASVVLGMSEDEEIYYDSGKEHLLAFAPTRSGKGIGMVIPTLLTWSNSVVVTDIKGENYRVTGWWRGLFSHVIYYNPTSSASAHYNPLLEIPRDHRAIREAMNLAEILGSKEQGREDPFWDQGAKKILATTILYVLYTQDDKSLPHCAQLLTKADESLEAMSSAEVDDPDVREFIRNNASAAISKSDKVRGGWVAGADGALDLWKDPIVAANSRTSDFRLEDLQYAKHPVSVYLVIPPKDLKRLSPLVRLFFQQLTDALTEQLKDEHLGDEVESRHRLLMLMDEFPPVREHVQGRERHFLHRWI